MCASSLTVRLSLGKALHLIRPLQNLGVAWWKPCSQEAHEGHHTKNSLVPGVLELPAWPAGKMCTLEYLPMVKEVFEDSLRRAARAHTLRREFFRELSKTQLGHPIELEGASHR